jgi:hypothetical protein
VVSVIWGKKEMHVHLLFGNLTEESNETSTYNCPVFKLRGLWDSNMAMKVIKRLL